MPSRTPSLTHTVKESDINHINFIDIDADRKNFPFTKIFSILQFHVTNTLSRTRFCDILCILEHSNFMCVIVEGPLSIAMKCPEMMDAVVWIGLHA